MERNHDAGRLAREVAHGAALAARGDPERTFGWRSAAGRRRAERRAELIARAAALGPGVRALEVGCGTGLFTEFFARTGARIVAVDISPDLVDLARRRGLPPTVELLVRPIEECGDLEPFDAVVGSSVLHHLDLGKALPAIHGLLRPGGRLAFAEPNLLNPQIAIQKNVPWIKAWLGDSPDETAFLRWAVAARLRRAGFTNVAVTPFDWLHPATPRPLISAVTAAGRLAERLPLVRELAGSLLLVATRDEGPGPGPSPR